MLAPGIGFYFFVLNYFEFFIHIAFVKTFGNIFGDKINTFYPHQTFIVTPKRVLLGKYLSLPVYSYGIENGKC